jgi:hypothetical protein
MKAKPLKIGAVNSAAAAVATKELPAVSIFAGEFSLDVIVF